MEIGIFSRTYETKDLEETCCRMRDDGIRHTQFNLSNAGLPTLPDHCSDKDIDRILRITGEYGIILDALSGTFNMIDPDEDARIRGCRQFAVQCSIAAALHIPIVSLCTGSKNRESKWKWHDDNTSQEAWDDLMRSTEAILPAAEKYNIILGVETEASNIINTPEMARKYLDTAGSDHIRIIMDGANLFLPDRLPHMHEVLDQAFRLLGKDIVIAHAKDFSCDGKKISFVAAGKGQLDYPYYIRLLKNAGYDGPLVMHGLSADEVPESAEYLRKLV